MARFLIILMLFFASFSFANDKKDILENIKEKASSGDIIAQNVLGTMYFEGVGVEKDIHEAIKWHEMVVKQESQYLAKQNDTKFAMQKFTIGASAVWLSNFFYGTQFNEVRNLEKSAYYTIKAIDFSLNSFQKDSMRIRLANIYWLQGKEKESLRLYNELIERNQPENLITYYAKNGILFLEKDHISLDKIEAEALKGDPKSQLYLGESYFIDHRVKKNINEAIKWFEMAAKQKEILSFVELSTIYSQGIGVQKNLNKAIEYLKIVTELPNASPFFQLQLVQMYDENGEQENAISLCNKIIKENLDESVTKAAKLFLFGISTEGK